MMTIDSDSATRRVFDPAVRFLHWLTAFLVAAIFALAFSIDFAASQEGATALTQLHRSFGLTVWIVMLGRLVWRQFARLPDWPAGMRPLTRRVKEWGERALYALMLSQPVLGLLQTNAHGERASWFFLTQLPALIGQDRALARSLHTAHRTVGLLLLGLIAVHASAALYHHFRHHDDTLRAMLPQGNRRRPVPAPTRTHARARGKDRANAPDAG